MGSRVRQPGWCEAVLLWTLTGLQILQLGQSPHCCFPAQVPGAVQLAAGTRLLTHFSEFRGIWSLSYVLTAFQ